MAQTDEFGEELADFVRRVAELKAARSVPTHELSPVLDAAIFELDHVADQLWPWYERLTAGASGGASPGTRPANDRQEQQLLRAVFQRFPLPVALVDRETVVRRLNFAATGFSGVRAGYATGRPLTGFLAHADRAAFRSQVAAVARGDGDRSLTVHLQQRPSAPVRASLTALRPSSEPRTAVLVVLQPGAGSRPAMPDGSPGQGAVPDLAETTRHAALMDLVDAMATSLLSAPPGDAADALERAARVLHGRFADWVVADSGAAHLTRTTVLGPTGADIAAVTEQDPAACPLVVEAARGGSTALQVRPEDPEGFGVDTTGAPVLVRADVTSLLCVPLAAHTGGTVQGVLTLFRTGARLAFSLAEAKAIDMMSRHIALAMRRRG
ncbi:PAS domain-containing protein [Streptomyces sp. PSKA54]|uniref:PAS domain-containing protein n=1 Tax=Streptomyces himalayensis subsp. aureolus TaxID=2758039 RepID=A0A7W2HFH7_9ACTN|nr:PAS domain-containing protein [Streptomyces himalayensis]MBA4861900.1 PAS domain-containing protein [Streptomyces himalayensis subsp. aureolus]